MSLNPAEYKEYVGIVVDRDGPDNSIKVFIPQLHGKTVRKEKLGWSRFRHNAGDVNFPTPDLGQWVRIVINTTGTSFAGEVIGLYQMVQDTSPTAGAATCLNTFYPQWREAVNSTIPVRIAPNLVEQEINGAMVRTAVEKNIDHSFSSLENIISTAAPFPLNGTILPSRIVDSAIIGSAASLTLDRLSSIIGGQYVDFGKIMNFIPSELLSKINSEVINTLTNITNLMGTVTPANMAGTYIPGQISTTSFTSVITSLLPTLNTREDVMNMFKTLHETDYGALADAVITEADTLGLTSKTILADTGTVVITNIDRTAQAKEAFEAQAATVGINPTYGYRLSNPTGFKEAIEAFSSDSISSATESFFNDE